VRWLLVAVLLAGCGRSVPPPERPPGPASRLERGKASWYGARFQGRKTASGERFDQRDLTAAHKTLRFGTRVRVTNESNGRSVVVRINDRGPYGRGRVIDLSRAAAEQLDMIRAGVVSVTVEVLSEGGAAARPR
jgi:rare lipoprotein A